MGIALVLALESHHLKRGFDRDDAVAVAALGTRDGFFPSLEPGRRRPGTNPG